MRTRQRDICHQEEKKVHHISRSLIVAMLFSENFISACEEDMENEEKCLPFVLSNKTNGKE